MKKIDYTKLQDSLAELKSQYAIYLSLAERNYEEDLQNAVRNSVVKCFEITYDTLWKMIRRYLESQGAAAMPHSPKGVFREAHQNLLIADIAPWVADEGGYASLRNDTACDYGQRKSEETLQKIGDFIDDAAAIYHKMLEDE